MAKAARLDSVVFFRVLAGVALGAIIAAVLLLWVIPGTKDYRPSVVSTIVIPLGCLVGWLLSSSRERAPTAILVCLGLYFLSAFAAARLGTLFNQWNYFHTVAGIQGLGGFGVALLLGFSGRALPQVERLRDAGDVAGLAALLRQGTLAERLEVIRVLDGMDAGEARTALLAVLEDGDVQLLREALSRLVGLATGADVPHLQRLLQHQDRRVRQRAWEVLHWVAGGEAREAQTGYWRRVLVAERGRFWLQALPLLSGALLILVSLILPWGTAGGPMQQTLWQLGMGVVVALLLVGSALLPPVEFLWGMGRRNMAGHLERLRVWAFLPVAILALALLGPLQGPTALTVQGGTALDGGFWAALSGVVLEFVGAWSFRA